MIGNSWKKTNIIVEISEINIRGNTWKTKTNIFIFIYSFNTYFFTNNGATTP